MSDWPGDPILRRCNFSVMRFLSASEVDMASFLRSFVIFSLRVRRRRISGRRDGADIRFDSSLRRETSLRQKII